MEPWKPSRRDQKQYPHFDAPLSLSEMEHIANDTSAVKSNKFYPFLRYVNSYRPFRPKGEAPKTREIRYCSRRDAAIFSRYRFGLSKLYEKELTRRGLADCVLAYRRIPVKPGSSSGKCNIHHAKLAFDLIIGLGDCCAVVMDITKYFEHLDHAQIKRQWRDLLGVSELPDDHYAVFKAITRYRFVDSKKAYEALGFFGTKPSGIPGYLTPKKYMPKQLCSPQEFRDKIGGEAAGYPDLIERREKPYGIPQGAPLSDLLANLYLLDFDTEMHGTLSSMGGFYMRYSDDLLLIIPGSADDTLEMMEQVRKQIRDFGIHLEIKERKCSVHRFRRMAGGGQSHQHVFPIGKNSNGLSYLGFRFDGEHVHLRDRTLGGFWRKASAMLSREAVSLVKRYPGKDLTFLTGEFNVDHVIQRVGRVRGFERRLDKKSWTFWTYVTRANNIFGEMSRIHSQLSQYRSKIRSKAEDRLVKTYYKSL